MHKPIGVAQASDNAPRIRVLFVAHDAQLHGAQLTLLTILRHLDQSKFAPFVVSPQSGPFTEEVERLGIPIWSGLVMRWVYRRSPLSFKSVFGAPWRLLRTPAIFTLFLVGLPIRLGRLLLFLYLHRIDVVYTNTVTVVDGAIAAKLSRTPHIWHLHENIDITKGLIRVLPARYVATSLTVRLSTRIAVPSHTLRDNIFGHQFELPKVTVIHNGVDTSRFRSGNPTHFLHKLFGIDVDAPLIGICGAIQESKGHDVFVKAASEILKEYPQAHFVVIGHGLSEYLEHLKRMASGLGLNGKIHFIGWRPDIPEIFRELQVVVIASKQEAFGLTAIESMATGIPIVCTRCGGPEEFIQHGVTGFLVEPCDPYELAKKVLEIIPKSSLRQKMSRAGQEKMKEIFRIELYAEKIELLINAVRVNKQI